MNATQATMVAMDGSRRIAVARSRTPHAGWLIKAYGFCWLDERARRQNIFGLSAPNLLVVETKKEARRIIEALKVGARHERDYQ